MSRWLREEKLDDDKYLETEVLLSPGAEGTYTLTEVQIERLLREAGYRKEDE